MRFRNPHEGGGIPAYPLPCVRGHSQSVKLMKLCLISILHRPDGVEQMVGKAILDGELNPTLYF
jgi:hypothetical protein